MFHVLTTSKAQEYSSLDSKTNTFYTLSLTLTSYSLATTFYISIGEYMSVIIPLSSLSPTDSAH